jgi:hypothetical protein
LGAGGRQFESGHPDITYQAHDPHRGLFLWCALDDPVNGRMLCP